MEAAGNCQWFLDPMAALGHQVWIGDAANIRANDARQQKHDRRGAALLLRLLMEGRFPRIWTPSSKQKDLRWLLIHRHKLERLRTQAKNGLQHLALNRGLQKQRRLWSKTGQALLRDLALPPWASRRREPAALSSRSQGVRIEKSWPMCRSYRWLVERSVPRAMITARLPAPWSSTSSGNRGVFKPSLG